MATDCPPSPFSRMSRSSKSRPATILAPSVEKNSRADPVQMNLAIGDDSFAGLNRHRVVPASAGEELHARNCDRPRHRDVRISS